VRCPFEFDKMRARTSHDVNGPLVLLVDRLQELCVVIHNSRVAYSRLITETRRDQGNFTELSTKAQTRDQDIDEVGLGDDLPRPPQRHSLDRARSDQDIHQMLAHPR